jgi:hypothetical protein
LNCTKPRNVGATKASTVRVDQADYERLEAEARRLGMRPSALVRMCLRSGLGWNGGIQVEQRLRVGLEALERLTALREELRRAGYPAADAVQLVREGREELEPRPSF